MSKINKRLVFTTCFLFAIIFAATGFGQNEHTPPMPQLNCLQCHTCEQPTKDDPCLKACPTAHAQQQKSGRLITAPDSMVLNKLVDQYGPVNFNHKLHSSMSGMGKGCASCHHFSTTGQIQKCRECHKSESDVNNLKQPSLKGAYHRQCLSCHREWSHDTKCALCHSPIEGGKMVNAKADNTDIMGVSHPLITEPVKQIYYTPYKPGSMVTFYHKEHIDLFGLRCVDCHQKENCGTCHDLQKPAKLIRTQEEVHAICSNCHKADRCDKCHGDTEKPEFSHATTGWALNQFHKTLDCRACHPTGRKITKLNAQCTSCHGGWNQENFRHTITGLQLDETHAQLDCSDCHINKKYNMQANCGNCHDDNRTSKTNPPGKMVKLSKG